MKVHTVPLNTSAPVLFFFLPFGIPCFPSWITATNVHRKVFKSGKLRKVGGRGGQGEALPRRTLVKFLDQRTTSEDYGHARQYHDCTRCTFKLHCIVDRCDLKNDHMFNKEI